MLHVIEKEHGCQKDYGKFSFQSMITNVLRAENSITNNRPQATVRMGYPSYVPKTAKTRVSFNFGPSTTVNMRTSWVKIAKFAKFLKGIEET